MKVKNYTILALCALLIACSTDTSLKTTNYFVGIQFKPESWGEIAKVDTATNGNKIYRFKAKTHEAIIPSKQRYARTHDSKYYSKTIDSLPDEVERHIVRCTNIVEVDGDNKIVNMEMDCDN